MAKPLFDKICPNCQSGMMSKERFCPKCGFDTGSPEALKNDPKKEVLYSEADIEESIAVEEIKPLEEKKEEIIKPIEKEETIVKPIEPAPIVVKKEKTPKPVVAKKKKEKVAVKKKEKTPPIVTTTTTYEEEDDDFFEIFEKKTKKYLRKLYIITMIGYVFLVINTFIFALAFFPLLWNLPICQHVRKAIDEKDRPNLAVAIVSLFVTSLIGGIFLIIAATLDDGV